MKDAIGGSVNIMFIAIFLLVVSGYLAFSVSYNKAFRVKNKIITILEQSGKFKGKAEEDIKKYIQETGYNTSKSNDKLGASCGGAGYSVKWVDTSTTSELNDNPRGYYRVTTEVTLDIPIINKIMTFIPVFQVSGDTITLNENNSSENCN